MITNGLIIVGAILGIVAMVVFLLGLAKAPEGIEDEAGFHFHKDTKRVRNRYYSAKTATARPTKVAKQYKTDLPAASAVPWDF